MTSIELVIGSESYNCNGHKAIAVVTIICNDTSNNLWDGGQLTLVFENEEMVVGMIKMRKLHSGFECVWVLTKLLV